MDPVTYKWIMLGILIIVIISAGVLGYVIRKEVFGVKEEDEDFNKKIT